MIPDDLSNARPLSLFEAIQVAAHLAACGHHEAAVRILSGPASTALVGRPTSGETTP